MSPAEKKLTLPGTKRSSWSPQHISVSYKRGVLAFRNENQRLFPPVSDVRREVLRVGSQDYAIVSWRGGEWEVYRVTMSGPEKGLEIFMGYAPDAIKAICHGKGAQQ
jgi:hypothetical protein